MEDLDGEYPNKQPYDAYCPNGSKEYLRGVYHAVLVVDGLPLQLVGSPTIRVFEVSIHVGLCGVDVTLLQSHVLLHCGIIGLRIDDADEERHWALSDQGSEWTVSFARHTVIFHEDTRGVLELLRP